MAKLLSQILRFVFSWVDAIIAKLITTIYKLLSDLSQLVLYSDSMVKVIGQRIGLILGIFMLFKLAISLINYMISPDKIKDGSKGGSKLIINVIVSLTLLISINFIFKEAYRIQGVIVDSRIIERIFFGESGILQNNKETDDKPVKMDIGYYLYTGFLTPNPEVYKDTCNQIWDVTYDITKKEDRDSKSCDELLYETLGDDARKSIYKTRNTLDVSYLFFDYDLILAYTETRVPAFNYTPIMSNACGIVVLLILISFSMDLATRAVKLLFLQIIAPIPIISNMDMGKGQDIFKKWVKECVNTYLSVFIRLIAINFAVFMIVLLRGNYKDVFVNNIWLNIFLIIGCLMFAKQVPGLIEEFLGIKLNGMALHPLKKFQEQALFGKQITTIAGRGATGVIAGAGAGVRALGANVIAPGVRGRILGAGAGFTSAFSRGIVSGLKGEKFGKVFSNSYNTAMANKETRLSKKDDDVKFWETPLNKVQRSVHQKTRGQRADELKSALESYTQKGEAIKNAIYANDKRTGSMHVNGKDFDGAKGLKEFIDNLHGPVQGEHESAADFATRQQQFLAEKKKYQDALDLRVAEVASGSRMIDDNTPDGSGGGAAANAAVNEILESMRVQRKSINDEGKALYGEHFNPVADPEGFRGTVGDYDTTNNRTMGMKNSLGSAAGAQTTISSHAGHDRDVDKYATKKDGK